MSIEQEQYQEVRQIKFCMPPSSDQPDGATIKVKFAPQATDVKYTTTENEEKSVAEILSNFENNIGFKD